MTLLDAYAEAAGYLEQISQQMTPDTDDYRRVVALKDFYEEAIEQLILDNEASIAAHARAVAEYDNENDIELRELRTQI